MTLNFDQVVSNGYANSRYVGRLLGCVHGVSDQGRKWAIANVLVFTGDFYYQNGQQMPSYDKHTVMVPDAQVDEFVKKYPKHEVKTLKTKAQAVKQRAEKANKPVNGMKVWEDVCRVDEFRMVAYTGRIKPKGRIYKTRDGQQKVAFDLEVQPNAIEFDLPDDADKVTVRTQF
ncbi:hypothetical protein ACIHFE_34300 [Streptomyces sp. NPDC052396]|uniref:hypothetical protein n=1 Tax=Streptomyces sp. NPDC052396 TaxID=3365689 RepID=UPI0037D79C3C